MVVAGLAVGEYVPEALKRSVCRAEMEKSRKSEPIAIEVAEAVFCVRERDATGSEDGKEGYCILACESEGR